MFRAAVVFPLRVLLDRADLASRGCGRPNRGGG
jgi:hypothetical protein